VLETGDERVGEDGSEKGRQPSEHEYLEGEHDDDEDSLILVSLRGRVGNRECVRVYNFGGFWQVRYEDVLSMMNFCLEEDFLDF